MTNCLVLVRHGQSEWNAKNLFTGWRDVPLTDQGREEAREAGQALKRAGFEFDIAFTSELSRAQDTNTIILDRLGQSGIQVIKNQALNERDYGDLTGLNKDAARKKFGEEQVHIWRRSFDTPPPGGESLKDTAARVLPYYDSDIAPTVMKDKTVLVTAHGNSLRALVMRLEQMSEDEITKLNIPTGAPIVYRLDAEGRMTGKEQLIDRPAH